jgi:hypothetical protein
VVAENSMAMAARYQPGPKDKPNANFDEQKYAFWLAAAREALKAAAPYYSPKLHAVYSPKLHAVAMQMSPLDDRQEADVDPRQTMLETYFAMRERGELAMKTVSDQAPKPAETNTNTPTPAPPPEDDADGVAV